MLPFRLGHLGLNVMLFTCWFLGRSINLLFHLCGICYCVLLLQDRLHRLKDSIQLRPGKGRSVFFRQCKICHVDCSSGSYDSTASSQVRGRRW